MLAGLGVFRLKVPPGIKSRLVLLDNPTLVVVDLPAADDDIRLRKVGVLLADHIRSDVGPDSSGGQRLVIDR